MEKIRALQGLTYVNCEYTGIGLKMWVETIESGCSSDKGIGAKGHLGSVKALGWAKSRASIQCKV